MWTKVNRSKCKRRLDVCPGDLTDAERASIAPVIPPGRRGGARRTVDVREIVNAIIHVPGAGWQWRAIPKDLPPRSAVHDCFDLRGWDGTPDRIRDKLCLACRDKVGKEASPTVAIIDIPAGGSPCARQSVKSAEKGGAASTPATMMRASKSRAGSGMSLSILKDYCSARWSTRLESRIGTAASTPRLLRKGEEGDEKP